MNITYSNQGEYNLANLTLPEQDKTIIVYGANAGEDTSSSTIRFCTTIF